MKMSTGSHVLGGQKEVLVTPMCAECRCMGGFVYVCFGQFSMES